MVKLCVIYEGRPQNADKFDSYYFGNHLPIVARIPKVRRINVSKSRKAGDDFYQIAEIFFDNSADLDAGLASPERAAAAQDRQNFPAFEGTIRYATFEIAEYPVKG